jgi:hypothetical protein
MRQEAKEFSSLDLMHLSLARFSGLHRVALLARAFALDYYKRDGMRMN